MRAPRPSTLRTTDQPIPFRPAFPTYLDCFHAASILVPLRSPYPGQWRLRSCTSAQLVEPRDPALFPALSKSILVTNTKTLTLPLPAT